jgi:hypothetical protein
MAMAIYSLGIGATWMDGDDWTAQQAVEHLRSCWNEDETLPQAFSVVNDEGVVEALLIRDRSNPSIALTAWRDGRQERHRCLYHYDDAGDFTGSSVEGLPTERREVNHA